MKYKTVENSPKLRDMSSIKLVSKAEFLQDDDLLPLLVCNQYRIYPDEFMDLKLLRHKNIALAGRTYLSGCESNIEMYYLDDFTIFLLTFSSVNLIYREYSENGNYQFRLKNYWQHNG